jgi:hypothetical protein
MNSLLQEEQSQEAICRPPPFYFLIISEIQL